MGSKRNHKVEPQNLAWFQNAERLQNNTLYGILNVSVAGYLASDY